MAILGMVLNLQPELPVLHSDSEFLTSLLSSELAIFCTAGVRREDPRRTLLRAARLEWMVCTSLKALYLSRTMKASTGESILSDGGVTCFVISSEPWSKIFGGS